MEATCSRGSFSCHCAIGVAMWLLDELIIRLPNTGPRTSLVVLPSVLKASWLRRVDVTPAAVLGLERCARPAHEYRKVVGAQPQLPVERERQVRAQADVEDRAREHEHDGHCDGEGCGHAQADRQPGQAALFRRSR